jgi:WD40 repeat protein
MRQTSDAASFPQPPAESASAGPDARGEADRSVDAEIARQDSQSPSPAASARRRLSRSATALFATAALLAVVALFFFFGKQHRDELTARLAQAESRRAGEMTESDRAQADLALAQSRLEQTNSELADAKQSLAAARLREMELDTSLRAAKSKIEEAQAAEKEARHQGETNVQRLQDLLDKQREATQRLEMALAKAPSAAAAVRAGEELAQLQYLRRVNYAHAGFIEGLTRVPRQMLAECPADRQHWEWHYVDRVCHSELSRAKIPRADQLAFDVGWQRTAQLDRKPVVQISDKSGELKDLVLKGHTAPVAGIGFSLNKKRIATIAAEGAVKVWDAETAEELKTFQAPKESRPSALERRFVALDGEGKHVAAAMENGDVKVWDTDSGEEVATLKTQPVALAISPDGKLLATAKDLAVSIWDIPRAAVVHTIEHSDRLRALAFSPDGGRLATATAYRIAVWDTATGKQVSRLVGHDRLIARLAFSEDGKQLASTDTETLRVWDIAQSQVSQVQDRILEYARFSPDGRKIAGACINPFGVQIRDAETGEDLKTIIPGPFPITALAFSPDWKRVAIGEAVLRIWDVETAKPVVMLAGPPEMKERPKVPGPPPPPPPPPLKPGRPIISPSRGAAFSPDGTQVAAVDGNRLQLWDAVTGKEIREFKLAVVRKIDPPRRPEDGVFRPVAVAFSADGKRLVTAGANVVVLWDVDKGQELRSMRAETGFLTCVAFRPDGKQVAAGSQEGIVRTWDTDDGRLQHTLLGHPYIVHSVSYHPDSKRLVSGGGDRLVRVWDAEFGHEAIALHGHTSSVLCVAFSPDGSRIVSCGLERAVRIWDTRPRPWRTEVTAKKVSSD